ncbi:MAG: MATE family efflux transporter [Butyricicoccaceae bacterium]
MEDTIKHNKMAVMPMGKLVFTMSLPLMISLLVQSLYNIVDGIFVAKLSEEAFTATTLAYPIQLLMIAVSVGTGVGVNALISRKLGAKQQAEANQAATTGLLLSLFCTLLFMLLGLLCPKAFANIFTQDAATALLCERYLRICMLFCLGVFVSTLAQRLLQATGNTFLSMISLVAGALTNIALDPIMIFGLLGCPAMGIQGAAIATVIGQWLSAIVALVLNYYKNPEICFVFRGYQCTPDMILSIYQVGAPTIVMQAMGSIMLSAMNAILMPVSQAAVAFFGAYYKLQNFLFMPMNGLGQAAIPIIGYNYGAKNGERVKQALKTAVPAAVCIALAGTLIFVLFPRQLLCLFTASDAMLKIGVPALRTISVTFVLAAVTMILGYSASGLGNGLMNMVGSALRQLIVLLPFAYLFARFAGVDQIWYAMWISECAAAIYSVLSIRAELKQKVQPLCAPLNN